MRCLILLLVIGSFSCAEKSPVTSNTPTPGNIPGNYIDAGDSDLLLRQDTLYYKHKLFSGNIYAIAQGDTVLLLPHLNGLKEGFCRKWFSGQKLAEERLYIQGKKQGIHKGWWENGKPQYVFGIVDDAYVGEFKEWNHEGKLIKLFHYKNGQEDGRQQLWYDDGKVRANYTIIDGRRYGLLGTKNCVNVSDSIFKK